VITWSEIHRRVLNTSFDYRVKISPPLYHILSQMGHVKPSHPIFLAYFPKLGLCDLHAVFVSVNPSINFSMTELIFVKLGVYIMAPEPNLMAYFTNLSHQSVCYVYPSYRYKAMAL
jgi:hypothetical protein